MSDYISREEAIQAYEDSLHGKGSVYGLIGKIPSADVRENIHGEWIEVTDYKDDNEYRWHIICSVCRHRGMFEDDNFCPNCGADMRGKAE